MAKLLGVIRYGGKLGQTIGYKGANGKRLVRARVDEISNPRSTGQNIQRMVFATAAVSLGHLSEVLRSSVEGVKAGAPSLAYLRGKALNMLRTSDIMQGNDYRYALKGQSGFVVNPYQISKGSLTPVTIGDFTTGSDNALKLGIRTDSSHRLENLTFSDLFPNVALGDQITIIQVALEIGTKRPVVFYCRFAAKRNDLPLLAMSSSAEGRLNEAALDITKCAGSFRDMVFGLMDGKVDISPKLQPLAFESDLDIAYGIIVSNRETGKRSTSFLKVASDIDTVFPWNADIAAPSYGNGGSPVDVSYDEYCDNSTNIASEEPAAGIELMGVRNQVTNVNIPKVNGVYKVTPGGSFIYHFNKVITNETAAVDLGDGGGGISIGSTRPYDNAILVVTDADAHGTFRIKIGDSAVLGNSIVIAES